MQRFEHPSEERQGLTGLSRVSGGLQYPHRVIRRDGTGVNGGDQAQDVWLVLAHPSQVDATPDGGVQRPVVCPRFDAPRSELPLAEVGPQTWARPPASSRPRSPAHTTSAADASADDHRRIRDLVDGGRLRSGEGRCVDIASGGQPYAKRAATLLATVAYLEGKATDDALDLFDVVMTTQLLARAQRQSAKDQAKRYPRVSQEAGKLDAAVGGTADGDRGQARHAHRPDLGFDRGRVGLTRFDGQGRCVDLI